MMGNQNGTAGHIIECTEQECTFVDGCFKSSVCKTTGVCFTSTTIVDDKPFYQRGCHDTAVACDMLHMTRKDLLAKVHMVCCNTSHCNTHTFVELSHHSKSNLSDIQPVGLILLSSIVLLVVFFVPLYFYLRKRKRDASKKSFHDTNIEKALPLEKEYLNSDYKPEVKVTAPDDSILREMLDGSVTSGSGSGLPLLVQRTLAKQIQLCECIGKGRYGEVWRGSFHHENVAVKIFFTSDEASWKREVEIYTNICLNDKNILPFIGSDVTSVNSCTELWLVTNYYPLGSLFDYLNINTLQVDEMFSIMLSIISGLNHLHTEVLGYRGKPAIAHRDIKSKNILMKTRSSCCIADFGLAVTHKTDPLDIACNYRVGTKRYMAPEVLEGTLQETSFNSYTNADIYSLSLVLWEIVRRTDCPWHPACSYKVPYQDMVPCDPSFEEMRKVVCTDNRRPEICVDFEKIPEMKQIASIIRESWTKSPMSRLPVLRIKKTLTATRDSYFAK